LRFSGWAPDEFAGGANRLLVASSLLSAKHDDKRHSPDFGKSALKILEK